MPFRPVQQLVHKLGSDVVQLSTADKDISLIAEHLPHTEI